MLLVPCLGGGLSLKQGFIHAYSGDGKGKTTAAIGLGIRAVGAGMKVIMIQFLKSRQSSELKALSKLEPDFKVFHFEKKRGFFNTLKESDIKELKSELNNALQFTKKLFDTKEADVIILDEIFGVIENGLVEEAHFQSLMIDKPQEVELILTGRKVPQLLYHSIDYISNIEKIKHPYDQGVLAREGIEF